MHSKIKSIIFLACLGGFLWASCRDAEQRSELLAKRYCTTCHVFPDPSLLDKKTWESGVFPEMAFRMGLDISNLRNIDPVEHLEVLRTIPSPVLSEEEFKRIRDYYTSHAPDTLIIPGENAFSSLHQFAAEVSSLPVRHNTLLTLIKYDTDNKKIFVGTRGGKLYELTPSLILEDSIQLTSAPADIIPRKNEGPILACMGIMDPNDQAVGSIVQLSHSGTNHQTWIDSLKRPVDLQQADLNNDGKEDLVVSAFGNFTGALLAYEKIGDQYQEHVIHNLPGTRKTVIHDFNEDGLPDILALITQGDEHIALFTNRGKFRFSYRIVLKFSPVHGSSYFELDDFNGDGHPDILYTNGDNADYSAILKPYHGVRIFLNDGKNQFTESWFHPMHGASMARAADFDNDGDLDIAAISFFPDFKNHPEQGFIYFENTDGNFTPHTTELASSSRWITMETGDIDEDGDLDIILGALTFPMGVPDNVLEEWKRNPASLLVLKNKLH